jgi:dTDP-glucose 4,6-dehydratase
MIDLNNRNILCTGGCGFIGSNFIEMLFKTFHDINVINMDKMGVGSRSIVDEMLPLTTDENNNRYMECICNIRKNLDDLGIMGLDKKILKFDYIFHFAAESHVDRSINSPSSFIENNVMGMTSLLEWARIHQSQAKIINISCYDEETKALTDRGVLDYRDIKIGDKVLSLNDKLVLEWKEVERVIIQDYEGDMIHFKSERNDLMVTPNHRMYYTNQDERELLFEDAESLTKYKTIKYFPRGQLRKGENFDEKEWAKWYLFGIYIGDGCSDILEKKTKSLSGLNKENYMKKSRNSKGQFSKYKASSDEEGYQEFVTQRSRRIFIHVPTGDKAREKTEKALNILGIKWTSVQKNETYNYIYTSDEWLYDSVQCFGKFAKEKVIPEDIINDLNYEQAEALFYGLIDSDGSYRNGHPWVLNTSSDKLAENALYLGNMMGFNPRLSTRSTLSYIDKRKIEGVSNCVYFRKSKIGINQKFERVPYTGKVWCLKVKDNKNFITVRNGITHLSGNTDEVYGHLGKYDLPFTENSPLHPRSPYSASKASADLIAQAYHETYGMDILTTRCCNNYGKHQHDEKFIPTVIRSLMEGKKIPVYGTGENVREWIHVEDHNKAILRLAEIGDAGGVYNVGSGVEKTNLEIIRTILDIFHGHGKNIEDYVEFVEDRKGHDFRYAIKSVKWVNDLKQRSFEDGMKETVEFYKEKYER